MVGRCCRDDARTSSTEWSMTNSAPRSSVTIFGLVEDVLANARFLMISGLVGGLLLAAVAFASPRKYAVNASFLPDAGAEGAAGLAAAARQFGIGIGSNASASWPPGLYVQVLSSQAMMLALAADSISDPEGSGRRIALVDLFEMAEDSPDVRVEKLVKVLRREVVSISESRLVGSVNIRVRTRWPGVSEAIAKILLRRVDEFNLRARLETAEAELGFIDKRVDSARSALVDAENRLSAFLTANRAVNEPSLQFQRDRLDREVRFNEQLVIGLAQQREEARLRRARDVPAFTVVEYPRAPAVGEPRGTIVRGVLGVALGMLLSFSWVIIRRAMNVAISEDPELVDRLRSSVRLLFGQR